VFLGVFKLGNVPPDPLPKQGRSRGRYVLTSAAKIAWLVPSKDRGRQIVEGDPRLRRLPFANIGHVGSGGAEVAHIETPIEIARKAASGP
jgi:hypothetical protein